MQLRVPLRNDKSLMHEEGACLPLRSAIGQCKACQTACPAEALSVSISSIELSDACTNCGRCTAACPTQALHLPAVQEFESELSNTSQPQISIECERVPAEHRVKDSLVLPCLGSLTPGLILSAHAATTYIEVIDRGWCADCSSNAGFEDNEHPALSALEQANAWLLALDDEAPTSSLALQPLPNNLKVDSQSPNASEPKLDRRSFFREVIARPAGAGIKAKAKPMGTDGRATYPASKRRHSLERDRQFKALTEITSRLQTNVPSEFFPTLHIESSCCDERMCVALCPTGALSINEQSEHSQLLFNSNACIACSNCVKACPKGSLTLEKYRGEPGVHVLIQHEKLTCTNCGDSFSSKSHQADDADQHDRLCLLCNKSRNLIADIGRTLGS